VKFYNQCRQITKDKLIYARASILTPECKAAMPPVRFWYFTRSKPVASITPETKVSEGTVTSGGGALAPLTGLPVADGAAGSRPSVAVKIDNAPEARPQSGLDVADVVYEEVVEGGVTRFIAVFHSTAPGLAGPVRSVRPMDPDILAAYRGLVAYSGGIPAFVSLLRKAPVQDVNVDVATDAYSWDKKRSAPHNEYVSPEKLWPKAKGDTANPPQATRMTKRLIREGMHMSLASLLDLSAAYQALVHQTADHREAVSAFLDKRTPQFGG